MKPKVLVILLVVIAILFVVGMALGARGGGSTPNLSDMRGLVARIAGNLAQGSALKAEDVSNTSASNAANCANLLTENGQAAINSTGFCQFSVRAKEKAVRSLSLQLIQGSNGRFTTENHTPEVNLAIGLNQCKQVQIMEDGGTLRVSCGPSATQCIFMATQCP